MGRAPALSAALDHALAAAREQYVRRHPRSLAAHIIALAAADSGRPPGMLPFPLLIVAQANGRVVTADGETLIDCRGDIVIGTVGGAAPLDSRKLRTLFHFDLLAAGLLVRQDAGLAYPRAAADAARLHDAIDRFQARRGQAGPG